MSFQGNGNVNSGPNNAGANNSGTPHNGEAQAGHQVPPNNQHAQPPSGNPQEGYGQPNGYVQNGQHFQGQYFQGQPPVQPPAPENKKNWFARHKIMTGVLGLVAFVTILAALGGGGDTEPTPEASAPIASTDSSKSPDEEAPAEEKPAEEKPAEESEAAKDETDTADLTTVFKIGDVADAGDMAYVVKGVKTASTVGPDFMQEKAKGKYVVVHLDVTNNSNESVLVSSSFFKLKSGEKTFEADSMASFSANSDEDVDNFLGEELNPDLSMSGYIVFDVSEKVAKAKDNVFQAQTGFWGTETVDILLSK